jgi:hypothetical protein
MTGFSFTQTDQNTLSARRWQAFAASYGGTVAAALTTAVGDMETAYTGAAGSATELRLNFSMASSTTLH